MLIGREDLLALADRRVRSTHAGAGHALFLAGEAGIGKTRLLTEVCERARKQDFLVVGVAAYPRDAEAIGGILADLAATLAFLPDPAARVGIRIGDRLRDGGVGQGDAYRYRRMLTADLAELVLSLGGCGSPVLLAVEDLHWADDLTLQVLERVARRVASVPLLILGTYRSDELRLSTPVRAWRDRLLTHRQAEEARLTRLSPDQTASMVGAIADAVVPAELAAAVYARSDGIPLHVEEFLAIVADPSAADRQVPDTLADAVLARSRDLSEPARALAAAAAVIGRSFDVDLLTAATGDSPSHVDAQLRELEHRFFVQPRGDGTAYDFRHALIRDALYTDLPPHQRRELHARVAAAATAAGFGAAFVSDQYERAHQPTSAYRHAMMAAAEASSMSAHREAVALYRRAQRTTPTGTPEHERADLLAALGAELAAIDDNAAAAAAYHDAYTIRRRLGDPAAAASLVPALVATRHLLGAALDERAGLLQQAMSTLDSAEESPQDVRPALLAALSGAYMLDRCLDDSIAYGRQAQSLAAAIDDHATRLNAEVTLGSALVFCGHMDEGWTMLAAAISAATASPWEAEAARGYRMMGTSASVLVEYDRGLRWLREGIAYADRTERFNDRHYMNAHLAHILWASGDWVGADSIARQALADGQGGLTTRITALHVLGYLALGRGDWSTADQHLDEARQLGKRMNELQRLSPALWGLAETALRRGKTSDAVTWCEQGYAASHPVLDAAYLFPFVVTGTRAYLALDEPTKARDWLDRCTDNLRRRNIPGTLPALDHARGLLHLADGHTGRARDALAAAGDGWNKRRRFWEGTQALVDQARAAHRSRRPGEAAALTAQVHGRVERTGATTLLAGLPVGDPAGPGNHPLTARETEVARLVATGATNRQIAEGLSISPKTVAAHIEHILAKLGASRRTEIAAWTTTKGPR